MIEQVVIMNRLDGILEELRSLREQFTRLEARMAGVKLDWDQRLAKLENPHRMAPFPAYLNAAGDRSLICHTHMEPKPCKGCEMERTEP